LLRPHTIGPDEKDKRPGLSKQISGASRAWISVEEAYYAANLEFAAAIGRGASEAELLARAHRVATLQSARGEVSTHAGWTLTRGGPRDSMTTWPVTLA
jgi:hypothetical protein